MESLHLVGEGIFRVLELMALLLLLFQEQTKLIYLGGRSFPLFHHLSDPLRSLSLGLPWEQFQPLDAEPGHRRRLGGNLQRARHAPAPLRLVRALLEGDVQLVLQPRHHILEAFVVGGGLAAKRFDRLGRVEPRHLQQGALELLDAGLLLSKPVLKVSLGGEHHRGEPLALPWIALGTARLGGV